MSGDDSNLIDDVCTRCLCDVGQLDYIAATAVGVDGQDRLILARVDAIGDETVRYDRDMRRRRARADWPAAHRVRTPHHDQSARPPLRAPNERRRAVPDTREPARRSVRLAPRAGSSGPRLADQLGAKPIAPG